MTKEVVYVRDPSATGHLLGKVLVCVPVGDTGSYPSTKPAGLWLGKFTFDVTDDQDANPNNYKVDDVSNPTALVAV